jgi:hypothetical protein
MSICKLSAIHSSTMQQHPCVQTGYQFYSAAGHKYWSNHSVMLTPLCPSHLTPLFRYVDIIKSDVLTTWMCPSRTTYVQMCGHRYRQTFNIKLVLFCPSQFSPLFGYLYTGTNFDILIAHLSPSRIPVVLGCVDTDNNTNIQIVHVYPTRVKTAF